MGQRVNIQYTVDLDELPGETNRMINKVIGDLLDVRELMQSCGCPAGEDVEDTLSLKTLDKINATRTRLADIDHSLSDIGNIISGFVAYKAEPQQQETSQELYQDAAEVHNPIVGPISELEQRLSQFKNSLTEQVNNENTDQAHEVRD